MKKKKKTREDTITTRPRVFFFFFFWGGGGGEEYFFVLFRQKHKKTKTKKNKKTHTAPKVRFQINRCPHPGPPAPFVFWKGGLGGVFFPFSPWWGFPRAIWGFLEGGGGFG